MIRWTTPISRSGVLSDWARRDNKVTKGDRVNCGCMYCCIFGRFFTNLIKELWILLYKIYLWYLFQTTTNLLPPASTTGSERIIIYWNAMRIYICRTAGWMRDCWLEVSIRKVLRPATSTQVFLGFPVSINKCWDGSQDSKLPLRTFHVALPT